MEPDSLIDAHITSVRWRPCCDYPPPEASLFVLRPPGDFPPRKVRAPIEVLVEQFVRP